MSIFLTIVIATIVITLIWPKSYTASASVMVDMRPDPVSAVANMAGTTATSYVATQVDIITSKRVAQEAVRLMSLDKSDEMRRRWEKETKAQGDYVAWVATAIGKSLEIKPSRESNVIDITYESPEPKFAAAMANAFARAYIDSTTQIRVGPARQYSEFFEERSRAAKEKLENAQAALAEAEKNKDILATDERLDIENAKLVDLSQQLLAIRALQVESNNRSKQARQRPEQSAEVLGNMVIGGLKSQLATMEANLNQLTERYGDQHPSVIEARAQIQTMQSKIAAETRRVTSSVDSLDTVNRSREAASQDAYEEQRRKVMRLKEERSKLSVLEHEVESASRIYEAIQLRASQTNLESNNSQSGVVLLSAATEPSTHSSPKMLLNVALAVTLGILLSLIAVLGLEMVDRRVRSSFDIMDTVELPVLGILPAPAAARTSRIGWLKKSQDRTAFTALTSPTK